MATLEDIQKYFKSLCQDYDKEYGRFPESSYEGRSLYEHFCEKNNLQCDTNNWCPHAIEGAGSWNKLDSITTGHTNCEKCNGTGAIPFETFEPRTMKFDPAWIKCDWCNNVQNNSSTRG